MIDNCETFENLDKHWINEVRRILSKEMGGAKEMADKRHVLDLKDLINLSSDIDFLYRISLMKAKEDDDLGLEDFVNESHENCKTYINIMVRSLEDGE